MHLALVQTWQLNFRQQNNIYWDLRLKLCTERVHYYMGFYREREDPCTLNEWMGTVKFLIENTIKRLKSRVA